MDEDTLRLGEMLWNYHRLGHEPGRADAILVLGSHDLRVAERGADLFLEDRSPLLIFSGGLGNLTRGVWSEPEADRFAAIARARGVPAAHILIENGSTNTGENIRFTRRTLEKAAVAADSFILVQKPYMERRAYATFRKLWPEKRVRVTSPLLSFRDYPTNDIPAERVIAIMVGDLQRILVYPARGFQISQEVPPEVLAAYRELIARGYTEHLLPHGETDLPFSTKGVQP